MTDISSTFFHAVHFFFSFAEEFVCIMNEDTNMRMLHFYILYSVVRLGVSLIHQDTLHE